MIYCNPTLLVNSVLNHTNNWRPHKYGEMQLILAWLKSHFQNTTTVFVLCIFFANFENLWFWIQNGGSHKFFNRLFFADKINIRRTKAFMYSVKVGNIQRLNRVIMLSSNREPISLFRDQEHWTKFWRFPLSP